MKEPANKNNSEEPSSHSPPVKPVMKDSTRRALAFIILCSCTVLILFTGPGFRLGFRLYSLASCYFSCFGWLPNEGPKKLQYRPLKS